MSMASSEENSSCGVDRSDQNERSRSIVGQQLRSPDNGRFASSAVGEECVDGTHLEMASGQDGESEDSRYFLEVAFRTTYDGTVRGQQMGRSPPVNSGGQLLPSAADDVSCPDEITATEPWQLVLPSAIGCTGRRLLLAKPKLLCTVSHQSLVQFLFPSFLELTELELTGFNNSRSTVERIERLERMLEFRSTTGQPVVMSCQSSFAFMDNVFS